MRFLFLLYGDEAAELALTPEARRAVVEEHIAFSRRLRERGALIGGDPLTDSAQAAVVRDGVVSDGPFAETKEQLGGYYLVEAVAGARRTSDVRERPNLHQRPRAAWNLPGQGDGLIPRRAVSGRGGQAAPRPGGAAVARWPGGQILVPGLQCRGRVATGRHRPRTSHRATVWPGFALSRRRKRQGATTWPPAGAAARGRGGQRPDTRPRTAMPRTSCHRPRTNHRATRWPGFGPARRRTSRCATRWPPHAARAARPGPQAARGNPPPPTLQLDA